jgi:hypothetical protein
LTLKKLLIFHVLIKFLKYISIILQYQNVIQKSPPDAKTCVKIQINSKNEILRTFPPAEKYDEYTVIETSPEVEVSAT